MSSRVASILGATDCHREILRVHEWQEFGMYMELPIIRPNVWIEAFTKLCKVR